jgi:hypothetical protein
VIDTSTIAVAPGRFATCGIAASLKDGRLAGSLRLVRPMPNQQWLPFVSVELKAESDIMVMRLSLSQPDASRPATASLELFPFDRDHNVRELLEGAVAGDQLQFSFEQAKDGALLIGAGTSLTRRVVLQSPIKEASFRVSGTVARMQITEGGQITCPPNLVQVSGGGA